MPIQSVLDFAHHLAAESLRRGGIAVDATVGNGHDTVALARAVGPEGQVFGIDVQAKAIEQTRSRLADEDVAETVTLIHGGHEDVAKHLPSAVHGEVGAVTFNLGYLPGSTSETTTRPETTISALDASVSLLRPGGVITIVVYTGHAGGPAEAEAVDAWASELSQDDVHALSYRFVNQKNDPPRLVAVEKRRD